jgi:hypothetical protein
MSAGCSCLEGSAAGNGAHMTDTPRDDDRNEELDEPPAPDPEETELPSEDDPEAD